ncbi:ribonuclease D [Gammaproteobacteria bacterium 42_54_T18]|nr:ribonuclease D [Gammaproteobacteria bacterium 42_54_T18]
MDTEYQFTWVDSDVSLAAMVEALQGEPLLAVDTEFMRTDTYYPIAALIQVASPDSIYLVDPLALSTLEPLRCLFYGEQLEAIVLHSCSEDLEVFKTLWQAVPNKIFDTQIAAAHLNLDRQPSLQKLLGILLGVDLPKDETRSNWLQRPLTDNQKQYAALDVAYLLAVYRALNEKLELLGRVAWVVEDCQTLTSKYSASIDFDNLYQSVGSAWKLNNQQLAVLKSIVAWRDRTAIEKNRPKGHVLKDATLFEIAERMPKTRSDVARCEAVSPGQAKRFGDTLAGLVSAACSQDVASYPKLLDKPFNRAHKALAKQMKDVAEKSAAALNMPTERLASRKLLERYAKAKLNDKPIPKEMAGWRFEVLVKELNAVFLAYQNENDNSAA